MARPGRGRVITLDGPAGSGKSTTAQLVARRLGFLYLDTGALYRALTVLALERGLPLEDAAALGTLAETADLKIRHNGREQRVLSGADDLTDRLRTPAVDRAVSAVSAVAAVRIAMLEMQRALRTPPGLVAEGRDLGTVVFPDADLKIYLVADLAVRAQRRALERRGRGQDASPETEREALEARDRYDSGRAVAPLRRAAEAIEVDTTALSIAEQVDRVVMLYRDRFGT